MSNFYKLGGKDGHQVIHIKGDALGWAKIYEKMDRRVKFDEVNEHTISTIFLGMDHGFGFGQRGKPIVFETMIFKGVGKDRGDEIRFWRYRTWKQAIKGHKNAVQWAQLLPDILIIEEIMKS